MTTSFHECQRFRRGVVVMSLAGLLGFLQQTAGGNEPSITFEREIRPIFRAHCLDCHGATDNLEGNLDLRLARFLLRGGDSGPAAVSGNPSGSLIIQKIRDGEMPPGEGKVPEHELKLLEQWVTAGLPTVRPEPETLAPGVPLLPEERDWWSFRPLSRPAVPESATAERVRTPVDALLRAAMPAGLRFSPDADRRTQLLRICFDLTGLPPSPEQLQSFLADDREDAYDRLVEELLASPHYGERWGRHWLDIAGYADSEGRTATDAVRSSAYRYRDYVIQSFNSGKPFDRFLHEQLAGDELAGPVQGDLTPEQIELFTATGFLRMAADGTGSGDNSAEARNLVVADTLQIVSTSLLGLTVACAQCHDHRYDPISHTDYFALRAVFNPALDWQQWKVPGERDVSLYTQADRDAAAKIEEEAQVILKEKQEKQGVYIEQAVQKELEKFEQPLREQLNAAYHTAGDQRTPEQKELLKKHPSVNISPGVLYQYLPDAAEDLKKFDARANEVRARKRPEEFLRALVETPGHLPKTHLFHRGDHRQPKQEVAPAAPAVLSPEDQFVSFAEDDPQLPTSGRRLAFARWVTSPDNPITARVIVNRIWMHHFGKGLVETPADFGRLGAHPTHPELLDWLASEFINSGWDVKHLHRLMVRSTAYRQSSARNAEMQAIDDINRFYWRKNVVRLDAEVLRDRVLSVTNQLDPALYGPPVPVMEDADGQAIVARTELERRSLYIQQRRSQPVSMLQAFDAPVMSVNCERRPSSTVATQSLMLMNSPFSLEKSLALAHRTLRTPGAPLAGESLQGVPPIRTPNSVEWQYGYGQVDEQHVHFTQLPVFLSGSWRGGEQMPDSKIGWVSLTSTGGHCGENPEFAAIRRWTASAPGQVRVSAGTLAHGSDKGDGVRGRLVSSRHGLVGDWTVHNQQVETTTPTITIEPGDTLDFITDCRGDVGYDSFRWEVTLESTRPDGSHGTIESRKRFSGDPQIPERIGPEHIAQVWLWTYCRQPTPAELSLAVEFLNSQVSEMERHPRELPTGTSPATQAFANLCQALLTSNEFLYLE